MTVDTTERFTSSVATGLLATTYTVPFQFYEIDVFVDGALMTNGVHYTITGGNGSTGSIKFTNGNVPPPGLDIAIIGAQTISQPVEYTDFDDAPSDVYERSIDQAIMALKEMDEKLSRSVRVGRFAPTIAELDVVNHPNSFVAVDVSGQVFLSPLSVAGNPAPSSSNILNASAVAGASVTDALNTLKVGTRERLSAPRNYFLRQDGNDANDGLSNTPSGAWRTPQKAMDTLSKLIDNSFNVTINIADGTYDALYVNKTIGQGFVIWQGNETTPSNVVFRETNSPAGPVLDVENDCSAPHHFRGIQFQNASGAGVGERRVAYVGRRNLVDFFKCNFVTNTTEPCVLYIADKGIAGLNLACTFTSNGSAGYQVVVDGGTLVIQGASTNLTLNGLNGTTGHLLVKNGGFCQYFPTNVTINGGPTVTNFVDVESRSYLEAFFTTFTGAVTGNRAAVNGNSVIETFGSAFTYLPGSSGPTAAVGGQYSGVSLLGPAQVVAGGSVVTFASGLTPKIQAVGTDISAALGAARYSNDANPARITILKSRGATVGANALVQSGDIIGELGWAAADGTNLTLVAGIQAIMDAATGVGDLPTRLSFFTSSDGAAGLFERMRITSSGLMRGFPQDALPAGGNAAFGYVISSGALGFYVGSGTPTLSAAKGSLYLRSDGTTTNNRAYINTDGGTTWTAITTVA